MQSIGERLEEARKRRGISVREASEATKIRGDFLLNFENNQFDVGLPEIYVRGFLRNYSAFLKIDPEKIVTDFNSTLLGESKSGRRDARELFGRMEIPERPRPSVEGNAPTGPTAPRRRDEASESSSRANNSPLNRDRDRGGNAELSNYVKIGLIVLGGIVSILVIVWLVTAIMNTSSTPRTQTPERPAQTDTSIPATTIALVATGDVWAKVTLVRDGSLLFDGHLAQGERKEISRRGAVLVRYTVGANLRVEINGTQFRMTGGDALGQSTIP